MTGPNDVAYRIVIHDLPSREAAHFIARQLGLALGVTTSVTVEADNFRTAETEPRGAVIEQVSLRKDTSAVRP